MKKLLSTILTLLMAISTLYMAIPVDSVKAVTENKLVSVTRWIPLGYDRQGNTLQRGNQVPWQRGSTWWGRAGHAMPATPEYWSVVYLTVVPSGGSSTEKDKVCCILDSNGRVWFDSDGYFHNPYERDTPDPPGECHESNFKQDTISSNNTMGPYAVGDYANFFHDEGYWFTDLGHVNGPYSFPHDFSGRCMKIGSVDLNGNGSALIMADVIRANCDPSIRFNISVETDLWEGMIPSVTAASIYNPNEPTKSNAQRIQKSTVLGAKSGDFQVPATTFHNISPEYRGWLGVEIFRDNGVNNINNATGSCFEQNLSDDYKAAESCEAFVGASATGISDTDTGLPLTIFHPDFYYHDEGGIGYGCSEAIYRNINTGQDPFGNEIVNDGDIRMTTITVHSGGSIITFDAGTVVTSGDTDVGFILSPFSNTGYYDADLDTEFDENEWIYYDGDGSGDVTAGDTRLSNVSRSGKVYYCGSIVAGPEIYIEEFRVSGFTLGRNGNPRALDIEILPGEAPISIAVDREFQVEQTSSVTVTMDPPPDEDTNNKAFVVLTDASGLRNVAGQITYNHPTVQVQITPYEGSCDEWGIMHPYTIEVYYEKGTGNPSDLGWGGPPDGRYGYWEIPSPEILSNYNINNNYDCYYVGEFDIKPEPIDFDCNVECLTNISSRFPNMTLTLKDWDNEYDVNDPNSVPISTIHSAGDIIATYNANGAGVEWMFTAGDGANRYIVQVNDNGSFLYWEWADNQSPTPGLGAIGAIDPEDTIIGPAEVNSSSEDFEDLDCSERFVECDICSSGFPYEMGVVTKGDSWGLFNGTDYPLIETYGVPAFVSTYKTSPWAESGGLVQVAVYPRNSSSNLRVRVHTTNAIWDYNSSITHPPYFVTSSAVGTDYCGEFIIGRDSSSTGSGSGSGGSSGGGGSGGGAGGNITDAYINFIEFRVIDHSLQYSNVNYTAGSNPLSPFDSPTPQIQTPYDPICYDLVREFRCYPGGQTHPLRIRGTQMGDGRSAYPAIWANKYVKLGTEFTPLTDYGIYFMLVDGTGSSLSFTATDSDHKIRRIEVEGPFKTPVLPVDYEDNEYNGLRGCPVRYDYSGRIIVDTTNWNDYELAPDDYTRVINPGLQDSYTYSSSNQRLAQNRDLDYSMVQGSVFVFDELIPVDVGVLSIEVELANGTRRKWEDCCQEYRIVGIPVHALHIEGAATSIGLGTDNIVDVKITEELDIQQYAECNDALVFAWQDRGIRTNDGSSLFEGAGDGWITGSPSSSYGSGSSGSYSRYDDINGDGRISFDAYETELIGSYNISSNTWVGGIIDARTYQRNNGRYMFDMSEDNGCSIEDFGWDFDGDHIISDEERLPVHLTAYKYGDDNNDRSFAPLWQVPGNNKYFSHEVYVAGEITMHPMPGGGIPKDPNITVNVDPPILTAGVSPEMINPDSPLTLTITDDSGRPVDLTKNGTLSNEEAMNYITQKRPDKVSEYYWTTTSLANDDDTVSNNQALFGFSPIKYDFSKAREGIYKFEGFVANDEGEINLKVVTPDYNGWGNGSIKIGKPSVSFEITNLESDHQVTMKYPEDDKATLTALDQRIYKVKAIVRDAEGNLIKGISNLPGKMGSATDFTRFTPFMVKSGVVDENQPASYNHLAVSVTDDVTPNMNSIAPMNMYYKTGTEMDGMHMDLDKWGTGCIYNSKMAGNYYVADFNGDSMIDYKDSLNIDKNGSATFYVFTDSEFGLGGFVGANKATVVKGDVAGDTPRSQSVSFNPLLRYAPDGKFALDWDTPAETYLPIKRPSIRIYEDKTGQEWGSEFLSASNYDLVNKADNVLVVKVSPSSPLETDPIEEGSIIELSSVNSSKSVTEETKRDPENSTNTYAKIHFEPRVIGESNVKLKYKASSAFTEEMIESDEVLTFDTVKGAVLDVVYSGVFYPGLIKTVSVNVEIAGSFGKPLIDVPVSLTGAGVNMQANTNAEGQAEFDVLPTKPGKIEIRLLGEYKAVNPEVIDVISSSQAPTIQLEEFDQLTRESEMTIAGKTSPDATLSMNNKPISISADGSFYLNVTLSEGENAFEIVAYNPIGTKAEKTIIITRDTQPPVITANPPLKKDLVDATEAVVSIELNEDAEVTIDNETYNLKEGVNEITIPIGDGDNELLINASDALGNSSSTTLHIKSYRLRTIILKIDNPIMLVDGEVTILDTAPYISSANRTLVPVRAISQSFGADVGWDQTARRVTVKLDDIDLSMVIGSDTAVLNGEFIEIDQPPEIVNGRTMVPFRFIAESLGAEVAWNASDREITMTRYY